MFSHSAYVPPLLLSNKSELYLGHWGMKWLLGSQKGVWWEGGGMSVYMLILVLPEFCGRGRPCPRPNKDCLALAF